jgi:hypothetical protein
MSVKKIKEELKLRWGEEPTVAVCFAIIDFMLKVPHDQLLGLMTKRVGVALRGQRENGVVKCDQGPGQYMLWEISR